MSADRIDVLSVMARDDMDARLHRMAHKGEHNYAQRHAAIAESKAARAAVAELIAAVSDVYGEPCVEENAADDPCAPGCMSCRIRTALARVGGAP